MTGGTRTRLAPTRVPPEAARYLDQGHWEGRLVDEFVARAAADYPERLALVDRERRVSFAEIAAAVDQAAGMLAEFGVEPGDVVSWQLPNWLEAAVVHHATVRVGAVSNPIVPIYRARELRFILRQARSRVLVVPDVFRGFDYRTLAAEVRGDLPDLEHVLVVGEPAAATTSFAGALASARPAPGAERRASDVALLLYTSGTASDPKGVLHSHDTLVYECRSIIDLCSLTEADRVFMASPVTHITGVLYGLVLPLMLGTSVVLQDVWDVPTALDLIERERCSFTVGATPFLHGLVHAPDLEARDVSSLRVFACGGADVPPTLVRAATDRLGISAIRVYGSTECPTITGNAPDAPEDRRAETDGRPVGPTEARVVDEDEAELARGVEGTLLARGPDLCLGYLDASLNERAFSETGWFHTGDLAVMDAEGYVRIAGRVKDIILRGGENLSAKEIEDLLFEHSAVDDVAVVGYPDEVLGERVCAFVVTASQLTLEELVAFLRERQIANQKLPERLRIVSELPRTASGKVQKFRLREQLSAEAGE
ncbi:MAG: AMP-binding protein [Solirubrobacteraceae bacterium]